TIEMCWLHRPVRGQARSYAYGRSGSGKASAADLNEQTWMRGYSHGRTWIWRPPQTCRSALAREGFVSDDRDVSAAPASSRASALLRLRQKRVRRGLGCGSQRANLDAALFSRAEAGPAWPRRRSSTSKSRCGVILAGGRGFGVRREPVGARLPAKNLTATQHPRVDNPPRVSPARPATDWQRCNVRRPANLPPAEPPGRDNPSAIPEAVCDLTA
ncbi:hypothetical protein SAMN05216197_16317, partial [Pseudomonas graminis]